MNTFTMKDLLSLKECVLFCSENKDKIWGLSDESIENLLDMLFKEINKKLIK